MDSLTFELGLPEHAKSIQRMREESSEKLTEQLGLGHWSRASKIASLRARLVSGEPETLRHNTIFVACRGTEVVASVVVSTFAPSFWKRSYWHDPSAVGLGVFYLVVPPELQRQGIGRFVMAGVEQLACDRQIPYVRLDAYATNPFSTGFYMGIGYTQRAEIELRGLGLILFEKQVQPVVVS